jgi:peptidoglycan hydrolase-like protein with peptidoglycan-binding domain
MRRSTRGGAPESRGVHESVGLFAAMTREVRNRRAHSDRSDGGRGDGDLRLPFLLQLLGWTARDAVGFAVGAFAIAAILVNVLFMQSGPHPAPIFKSAAAAMKTPDPHTAALMRRGEPIAAPAPPKLAFSSPRTPGEIITDIQRELARRGYYDGALDGLYGPKTDAAIRDFEHASGLKPSAQPNEALLQAIIRSPGKTAKGVTGSTPVLHPPAPHNDQMVEPSVASPRVIALQRALAEFGYGQIKSSGIVDADTQRAIERFEREHKLPVTGQFSDRVVRELAATTGRPLE